MTVPSFEPQPTMQPLSCRRRLERGSSQIWGGEDGRVAALSPYLLPRGRQTWPSKPTCCPVTGACVQNFGPQGLWGQLLLDGAHPEPCTPPISSPRPWVMPTPCPTAVPVLPPRDGRGSVGTDLQAEGGVVLLEEEIPDVQGPVHLGREEDSRPHGAPAAGRQVGEVVSAGDPVLLGATGRAPSPKSPGSSTAAVHRASST